MDVRLRDNGAISQVCLDSRCTMTLIDRQFLKDNLPDLPIQKVEAPITVRGIGSMTHKAADYVKLDIYIPGRLNGKPVLAHLKREAYVVNELQAKMLLGVNVLGPEEMRMDFKTHTVSIGSCIGTAVEMNVTPRSGKRTRRVVRTITMVQVPAHTLRRVPIKIQGDSPLSQDRNLLFDSEGNLVGHVYAHLVDAHF